MFGKLKGRFEDQDRLGTSEDNTERRTSRDSARRSQQLPQPAKTEPPPPFSQNDYRPPPAEKAQPPPFSTNFASVSLHMSDRVRLLQLPMEQRDAIRNTIKQTWPRGIQNERDYHGSWEFKMSGNPWSPYGENALYARRLTRGILATLYEAGWVLYIATDISRNPGDKDNLFFRHQSPAPTPCEWFSITFSKGDRIRLIDAPQEVLQDTLAILRAETQRHEPYRIPGVYEIKLNGWPFAASGGSTMVSRSICLKLFSMFEQHGFTVSASLDQKYGGGNGEETDTWHLSRPIGWAPGAPVYHQ